MSEQQHQLATPVSADRHRIDPDVASEARRLKEMMLTVHYFAEASWLVAAMEYPRLCRSAEAQRALRDAAKIAWQWGAPGVALWLNTEVLDNGARVSLSWSDQFPAIQDPTLVPATEATRS